MPNSTLNTERFCLPHNLTLRTVTATHQELMEFMKTGNRMVLEFSPDSQIDVSLLQLLEAARVFAATGGKTVELAEPATGTLLDTLRRSGFLEGMSDEDAKFWLHQGEIQ